MGAPEGLPPPACGRLPQPPPPSSSRLRRMPAAAGTARATLAPEGEGRRATGRRCKAAGAEEEAQSCSPPSSQTIPRHRAPTMHLLR